MSVEYNLLIVSLRPIIQSGRTYKKKKMYLNICEGLTYSHFRYCFGGSNIEDKSEEGRRGKGIKIGRKVLRRREGTR